MSQAGQQSSRKNLIDYCERFSNIKVNKSRQRGEAPYKPVLLLSVIDLISQGIIQDNCIYITDELINTFNKFWNILNPEAFNGGLALPFFHLKNDGFWKLKFSEIYDGGRPQTLPKLKEDVDYAVIDEELYNFLQESDSRKELIDSLISAWFSASNTKIEEVLTINENLQDEENLEQDSSLNSQETPRRIYLRKTLVRDAFFRKAVVHLYNYRCAFCRIKVIHSLMQSIVDGAHIKPFAKFYDSKVDNGLSLCKNHHWAFDQGLFTISDDYKIIVTQDFQEDSPNSKPFKDFNDTKILLPDLDKYYPRLEAIKWHRQNIFRS